MGRIPTARSRVILKPKDTHQADYPKRTVEVRIDVSNCVFRFRTLWDVCGGEVESRPITAFSILHHVGCE